MSLLTRRIEQDANIASPIARRVITGDLKKQIGAPVKTGDAMFIVAPIDSLRAEISVPEDQIADVHVGKARKMATTRVAGSHVPAD